MTRQIILLLTILFVCFPFPFVTFANGYVYVTNEGDNTVTVINPISNSVIDKIPVGSPRGIALDSKGKFAYVANKVENTVTVIDTSSNSLAATVAVGSNPHCLAFDSVRNLIYVVNSGSDSISVIDTNNNALNGVISIGSEPWGVTVDPAGKYVYATNDDDNSVSVIDAETQKVTATIHVGTGPLGIAVNPDGTKVYVANENDNTVSVIDTATNTVTHTINDAGGTGIAINPSGTEVWVAHGDDVLIIDNNEVTETISVGGGIDGIAFNSSGTRAYTASEYSNTVSVINTTTKDVIATIEDGIDNPFWIAVAPADYKEVIIVLTDASPNATVEADSIAKIYGTNGVNNITVESGADVELVNFPGSNTVNIESNSEDFTVSRSGATVTFQGSDGTRLKIPATQTAQIIDFTDLASLTLRIYDGQVMLGDQVVTTTAANVQKEFPDLVVEFNATNTNGSAPLVTHFNCQITSGSPPYEIIMVFYCENEEPGPGCMTSALVSEYDEYGVSFTYDTVGVYTANFSLSDCSGQFYTKSIIINVQ